MTQHPTDPARPDAQPTSLSTRGRRAVVGMEERDALRAEVGRLRAEVVAAHEETAAWREVARPTSPLLSDNWRTEEMVENENAVLAARVARLEAALQQVVDEHEMTVGAYEDAYGGRADAVAAARAALEGTDA